MVAQSLIAQATADASDTAEATDAADVASSLAAEAQARAQLDTSKLNLLYSTIRSPIRGTVITRNVDVGQTVAASFAAPTLFLIGEDLTKMEVDTNIAEADVGALAPGMAATFTVDAFPTKVFLGTIRQVRASPQVVQNVVTYNAVVDVANPKLELKPGMTANLESSTRIAPPRCACRTPRSGFARHRRSRARRRRSRRRARSWSGSCARARRSRSCSTPASATGRSPRSSRGSSPAIS